MDLERFELNRYEDVYTFLRNKLDKNNGYWSTYRGYIHLGHVSQLSRDGIGFRLYSSGMLTFHDKKMMGGINAA